MNIRWHMDRDPGGDLSEGLLPVEVLEGQRYRHAGRHRQWQHGRFLSKSLLCHEAQFLGLQTTKPEQIRIQRMSAGWPQAQNAEGRPLPISLSISHCGDWAVSAACAQSAGHVGADLERVESRSQHFIGDYFTDAEQALLGPLSALDFDTRVTAIWSIKEAVLKALGTGLADPATSVEVLTLPHALNDNWQKAHVQLTGAPNPKVRWRLVEDDLVLVLAQLPVGSWCMPSACARYLW